MKLSIILAIYLILSSCRTVSSRENSVIQEKELQEIEEEPQENYSLAAAVAYGMTLTPVSELKLNMSQIKKIPESPQGFDPYCELEAAISDATLYPEETYNLYEIEGEDFSGINKFLVEIHGSSRNIGFLRCFNLRKPQEVEVSMKILNDILKNYFKISLHAI